MAYQKTWTTLLPFLYPQPCCRGTRLFSTSVTFRSRPGGAGAGSGQRFLGPRAKPQKSMQVLMKENDGSRMPMDLGLLEGQ